MIFRVNEDCVVRASGHAGLATYADGFVEIDNPVCALEHRRGGTGGDARGMRTLIATRYLVSAAGLRKDANVDMLYVSARH